MSAIVTVIFWSIFATGVVLLVLSEILLRKRKSVWDGKGFNADTACFVIGVLLIISDFLFIVLALR